MAIKTRLIQAGLAGAVLAAGTLTYEFEGEHRGPYLDPVGIETACIGHVGSKLKEFYTGKECTGLFVADLIRAEKTVDRCTPNFPEAAKPALISFVFNVGSGAYCSSTLAKKANTGDHVGACKELYRWVYAKGEVLPGLVRRRKVEAELCLSGLY